MKVGSIKENFIFNVLRLILNFSLPLIVFPYVSRVLGPIGIGKVEFANSIISYFILFSSLGIPTYGIREIARVRDNDTERSKVVYELGILLLINSIISYIIYFILIFFVPKFNSDLLLFLVISPSIILTDLNFEFFYQGIEKQKYITIRYAIVKVFQILFIYLFVKNEKNYIIYALSLVGMNSLSTIFNLFNLRKYLVKIKWEILRPLRHFKNVLIIFSSIVAINIYTHLDVTMVGLFVGDEAVGVYSVANKLVRMILTIVTALSPVMIPRLENSIQNKNMANFRNYAELSLNFIIMMGIPCFIGIEFLAPEIVVLYAGKSFLSAIISVQILAPIILIVGMANFIGLQLLYHFRREIKYTISVSIAACCNFIVNLCLIPVFKQNGAIIGTVVAEILGLCIQYYYVKDIYAQIHLSKKYLWHYFIGGGAIGVYLFLLKYFTSLNNYLILLVGILGSFLIYGILLIILKNPFVKIKNIFKSTEK